jgi:hypothetical protein
LDILETGGAKIIRFPAGCLAFHQHETEPGGDARIVENAISPAGLELRDEAQPVSRE